MTEKYVYEPHPHVEARKQRGPAVSRRRVDHESKLTKLNNKIGLYITTRVGTMWAAYIFFGLTLVSLPAAIASGNIIVIVSWVAQLSCSWCCCQSSSSVRTFRPASDDRAIATYEDAGAILEETKEIQSHLAAQDEALGKLIDKMIELEKGIK